RLDRRETVDQPQAAVAVPVPINLYTVLLDDFPLDEFNQSFHSSWCSVPDRIGQADACRSAVDGRPVQSLERFGLRAGRVLGDVHDRAAVLRSEEHTSELQSPCNLVCRLLLEKNYILQLY